MYFNKSLVYKRRNVFSIRLTNEIKIQVIKYDLSIKCNARSRFILYARHFINDRETRD